MKVLQYTGFIAALSFAVGSAFAGTSRRSLPILGEYETLYDRCEAAGNDTYVSVLYEGSTGYVDYVYGQCYPFEVDGNIAQQAVVCKSVTCTSNPNPDCSGGATPPVGIPIPAGLSLLNVDGFVQLLGQGAICWPNGISV